MAKELDGLPDLWGILRRLLTRRRKLSKTAPKPQSSLKTQYSVPESMDLTPSKVFKPTNKGFVVESASDVQLKKNTPRKPQLSLPVLKQATLAKRLQDQSFLKQAIVVNELLNKPLALRNKRPGFSNRG